MPAKRFNETIMTATALDYVGVYSNPVAVEHMIVGDLTLNVTNPTQPTNKTFLPAAVTAATGNINVPSHGYITGVEMYFSTTGTLPSGISALTSYFAYVIDADNFKIATQQNFAVAGTTIAFGSQGTGTHTAAPQNAAIPVALVFVARSAEPVPLNWLANPAAYPSTSLFSIFISTLTGVSTANSPVSIPLSDMGYSWIRILATASAGMPYLSVTGNFKGY